MDGVQYKTGLLMFLLGFSTGSFYKTGLDLAESIEVIRKLDCRALELGLVKNQQEFLSGELQHLDPEVLNGFEYVSLHAPLIDYRNNEETRKILREIAVLSKKFFLDLVVFHPDLVYDFSLLDGVGFNVALENMDRRKARFKVPTDFEKLLAAHPEWQLVLDVNHIKTNDPTMKLAKEFYERFPYRLSQIHLSGYVSSHEPLYQTEQREVLEAIQDFDVPVIVESVVAIDKIDDEFRYILHAIEKITEARGLHQ